MSSDGIGRLTQMLELNEFKLNSLLEITKGINNNLFIKNSQRKIKELKSNENAH